MKSGSTGYFKVTLAIDLSLVNSIIFTMKSNKDIIQKEYPGDVTYEDGKFLIPLDQHDTTSLQGYVKVEAQINLLDGGVTKSEKPQVFIGDTLATRYMENNTPADIADVDLAVEPIQIVRTGGGGDSYTKAESDAKYATKTALAEKADKSDIPTDYATTEQLQAVAEMIPTDYASKSYVDGAIETAIGGALNGSY